MSSARERFETAASDRGLDIEIRHWPQGTRTAKDAAAAVGCDVAQIVKSLVLVANGSPIVALTSGKNRVDTERLAQVVGASEVRMADADEVREATGFAIGGTPPFGYPHPLQVVMDADLLDFDEVWAAAGTPDTTFPVDPETLRGAAAAQVADFAER